MRLYAIGGGKMGQAIIAGLLRKDIIAAQDIFVIDPHIKRHDLSAAGIAEAVSLHGEATDMEIASEDVVLLAVKPQVMDEVLSSLPNSFGQALVVSIAAGISTDYIAERLGGDVRVIRVMPNTPAAVGLSMSVFYSGGACGGEDKSVVEKLFSAIGEVYEISDEDMMHGVTAVSGSGPAYVFYFLECFMAVARELGLSEDLARRSVLQVMRGGLALVEGGGDVVELRRNVTSPGGTTEAALGCLGGEDGLMELMRGAMTAAAQRSRELG